MEYFKVLICALIFLYSVKAVPLKIVTLEDLKRDMKHREMIGLECLKQTKLNRTVVDQAVHFQFTDDQKYKDFLACSYKKQGFQSDNGKMLYDQITDYLNMFYTISDLNILNGCKRVSGANDGEIAFNSMKCITAKLQEIESKELNVNKV